MSLITDCEIVEVDGLPDRMEARVSLYDGEIIIWDGIRQYSTGATEDGPQLQKALRHHWATVWVGKHPSQASGAVKPGR